MVQNVSLASKTLGVPQALQALRVCPRRCKHFIILAALCLAATAYAGEPWRLRLTSEEGVELHIDLYEESIDVPGLSLFGPMNGYLGGKIYGVWPVTSFEIKDSLQANLRVSNDLGSETQRISLQQQTDTTWVMTFEGYNAIRRVNGKKLAKVPSRYVMKRK